MMVARSWKDLIDELTPRARAISPSISLEQSIVMNCLCINLGRRHAFLYGLDEILNNIHKIDGDLERRVGEFMAGRDPVKAPLADFDMTPLIERTKRLTEDARLSDMYGEAPSAISAVGGLRIASLPSPGPVGDGIALTSIAHPGWPDPVVEREIEVSTSYDVAPREQPDGGQNQDVINPFDPKNWGV